MTTNNGFTLIEVMITLAIITVLVAVALPAYQSYTIKSQLASALADITAGKVLFESRLVADDIASFDIAMIGLPSSTPRCSSITLVPGVTGEIRCVLNGAPQIVGESIVITRGSTGLWSCTAPTTVVAGLKPQHCN
jgi:type IV pilus assembly protein PilA